VQAHVFVSWLHPFKEQRFVVVGDRQMAVFDDTREWSERLVLYPHQVDWVEGRVPVARKAAATAVPLVEAEPLVRECEAFVHSVVTRTPPLTDGASGVDVIRVLAAAERSLQGNGRPETLVSPTAAPERTWQAHPTATIDEGAVIGAGTRIWHYSHVMKGAEIGLRCVIGQNAFIASNVKIGNRVKIQNNVSLYEGVELEDEVFCGPSMVFTNVINPRSGIERKSEFRPTVVRRGATLGANCTIVCGHEIGRYAFVAAGAVVTRDVPDHALVAGVPARVIGWTCVCAGKLEMSGERGACGECGRRYAREGGKIRSVEG
jgi:UDP-2-acetamido-3-amino-2,3-dideoxy-glucuronate N-acetyltransferase